MEKIPPFYVGQRVVAVRDSISGKWKKGDEFTVRGLLPYCHGNAIDIGFKKPYLTGTKCEHCSQRVNPPDAIDWCKAKCFAPITSTFQNISFSKVLEAEQELIGVN